MNYDTFLTAEQILTPARDEAISSSSSQVTSLGDPQMVEYIHTLNSDFILAAHAQHHARGWSWLRKTGNFKTVSDNRLSADIVAGAATFTLDDATDFPDIGRSVMETNKGAMDFVDNKSKSGDILTTDTAAGAEVVSMDHATDRVHKLYAAAPNFGRVHQLWVNTLPFRYEKFNVAFPRPRFFTIYGDYFLFPRGMYQADVSYLYEIKHNDITALESETNIPREFLRYAVEMTLAHLFMVKRKRADMPTSLQLAELALEKALVFDATQATTNEIRLR